MMGRNVDIVSVAALRRRAQELAGRLRRGGPELGGRDLGDAAEIIEALLARTEYLTVAEWIGSSMLASERIRRTGWLGRFRAWRLRRRVIRQDLRRIGFGEEGRR